MVSGIKQRSEREAVLSSMIEGAPSSLSGLLLFELELFLHDKPEPAPVLVKAALAHVQFETIHPSLDGDGRLGRLLITLLLCEQKVLREPMLYLSLYFRSNGSSISVLPLMAAVLSGKWAIERLRNGPASDTIRIVFTIILICRCRLLYESVNPEEKP